MKTLYGILMTCFEYDTKNVYTENKKQLYDTLEQAREAVNQDCLLEIHDLNELREERPFDYATYFDGYDFAVRFWDGDDYRIVTGYEIAEFEYN